MVTKKKRNWKEYNESLVRRGELLFDTDFLSGWGRELEKLNEEKEGARYRYPSSLMSMLAAIHVYLLPYRELEGFLRMFSDHVEGLKDRVPDYTTMWWRISRVEIELDPNVDLDEDVTIAVDSTGIKVSNRGEWIRQMWAVKRGFIKVHLAVDVKTGKILSMEVTKDGVHDRRMLVPLVEAAASRANVTRAIADGAYDSREIFSYLDRKGIEPVVKVRKDASVRALGCMPRKLAAIEQLRDRERWKRSHGYGQRARVESAISSFKRTFGEHISSVKWDNMVNELLLKAQVYDLFVGISNP